VERGSKDKPSSLLGLIIGDEGKKFYNIGPRCQFHQYFMSSFFVRKIYGAAFTCFQFGFAIYWQNDFGAKAAHKMLVKLTPGRLKASVHLMIYLFDVTSFFSMQAFVDWKKRKHEKTDFPSIGDIHSPGNDRGIIQKSGAVFYEVKII